MPNKATLYPIYALAGPGDERLFDTRVFPYHIVPGVTVEDVRPMFNPDTFAWVRHELGRHDVEELERVDFAIVHRYTTNELGEGGNADTESDKLVRNLVACLRLIRANRVAIMFARPRQKGRAKKKSTRQERPIKAPAVTEIFLLVPFARCGDFAEETVTLILNACGEEELVGVSCHKAIAESQSPKAVNGDGMAFTTAKLTVERVALEIARNVPNGANCNAPSNSVKLKNPQSKPTTCRT